MGANALVFTGKMDYRPNVDAVLWFADAVLPLILAQAPDVHFYVVGQQPHERVKALADHPAITVTGRVPDARPYIAGAGVYVVPLRIGGGTRLKVLEAMAMGQAIVSTRLGCDGFPFADGREVRFADEPAAFAAAVVRAAAGPRAAAAAGPGGACLCGSASSAGTRSCRGWRRCTRERWPSAHSAVRQAAWPAARVAARRLRSARPCDVIGAALSPATSSRTRRARSLLLIRPDHLGDMLFLTPALHALRHGLPPARITLLAGPWGARSSRHNPDLDAVETLSVSGLRAAAERECLAPYRSARGDRAATARPVMTRRWCCGSITGGAHGWPPRPASRGASATIGRRRGRF